MPIYEFELTVVRTFRVVADTVEEARDLLEDDPQAYELPEASPDPDQDFRLVGTIEDE